MRRSLCLLGLLIVGLSAAERPEHLPLDFRPMDGGIPVAAPSENADRRGSYQAHTSTAGYDYWVHVPAGYDPAQPVGLALFFHGQGGHGGAKRFGGGVDRETCNAHNLVYIKMQYQDGDNAKDTAGKVEAAKEAIAQVLADYPVVPGRGIVTSFSGGGLPHGGLVDQLGRARRNQRGYHWPFCHTGLYGSNFWTAASGTVPMGWTVAVGQKEWDMGKPPLGQSGNARIGELAREAKRNPDFLYLVAAGKGHQITDEDRAAGRRMFERSDLFHAPFIYTPDYADRAFRGALQAGMRLRYGQLLTELDELLVEDDLDPELRAKAERLHAIATARSTRMVALIEELLTTDPLLGVHYGKLALGNHLRGHPAADGLQETVKNAARSEAYRQATAAAGWWYANVQQLVKGGSLVAEYREALERIVEQLPASAEIAISAQHMLAL